MPRLIENPGSSVTRERDRECLTHEPWEQLQKMRFNVFPKRSALSPTLPNFTYSNRYLKENLTDSGDLIINHHVTSSGGK